MPYAKLSDANPAIRGIEPPVTLAQANHIARMADAIKGDGANPWAVALSQFRKLYRVEGDHWVRRSETAEAAPTLPACGEAAVDYHCPYPGCGAALEASGFDGWYRCDWCGQDAYVRYAEDDGQVTEAQTLLDAMQAGVHYGAAKPARALVAEQATIKAVAQRLMRDLVSLLAHKELPAAIRKEVEDVRRVLRRTWSDLEQEASQEADMAGTRAAEARMKTMDGVGYPASAFLVVEDPDSPSTWHLRVRDKAGKPDHRQLGAAWAALHGGYRGQRYEGPGKAEALRKLKALYKAEDMEVPGEGGETAEFGEPMIAEPAPDYVPFGVHDFDDLDDWRMAQQTTRQVDTLTRQFQELAWNVLRDPEVPDKTAALARLVAQYGERSQAALDGAPTSATGPAEVARLAEAEVGQVRDVVDVREGENGLVSIDFVIIEPGFGNKRDNFYYPAPMLREHAHVFTGAKMYETDHRQEEKSTRTWVSTCTEIAGFTPSGAPIGRAVVHDPDFAARARNLKKAGLLELLTNSIMAKAMYRVVERDGAQVKEVQSLLAEPKPDVDWVTRPGAGGHAVALSEAEAPVNNAKPEREDEEDVQEYGLHETTIREDDAKDVAADAEPAAEQPPAEGEAENATTEAEDTKAPVGATKADQAETAAPQAVSVEKVTELATAARLPQRAVSLLLTRSYASEAEVLVAVGEMEQLVREVRSAGRVVGNTGSAMAQQRSVAERAADESERIAAVLERHGVIPTRPQPGK